ncbi:MAG TPA: 4-hydroxyphenylacetate 3-hydroxylase N-terminal domain-containing protein [Kofleriaceae bacterium]
MRTGTTYRDQLSRGDGHIWYGDREYRAATEIDAMQPQIASICRYYDFHHEDPLSTYRDVDGLRSIVHLAARTHEELARKGQGLLRIAASYEGMLGRAPDFIGCFFSALQGAYAFFGKDFEDNVRNLALEVQRRDLFATHSTTEMLGENGKPIGVRVVAESSAGLEIVGMRAMATSAPVSDLLVILPNRLAATTTPESTVAFALPISTRGLHLVARRALEGVSPLSRQYEESDALVVMDRVLVPWSHVLVYKDEARYLGISKATGGLQYGSLQTAARSLAKLRSILTRLRAADELFRSCRTDGFRSFCGRVLRDIELLDASYERSIEHGFENEFGLWVPHMRSLEAAKVYFMQSYPSLIQELRRLMAAELFHLVDGERMPEVLADALGKAWGVSRENLTKRLELTHELFDLAVSSFGVRQELYEMYKAGSPDRAARGFMKQFADSES